MKNYTVNIYIEKSRLTQFHGINKLVVNANGEVWTVNIFDSYNIAIVNGKLETNIDIFYVGHHDTYNKLANYQELLGDRLVYVRQQTKSANIATYNKFIENDLYIEQEIYDVATEEDASQYCFKEGVYYVKPEYGARSINQFIVDSSKCSLAYFVGKLNMIYDEDKDKFAESIKTLVEGAKGAIKHVKGNEREENEHSKYKMNYCIHRKFEDVALEYRVIQNNYGEEIYFLKRERNESNDGIVDNEINYVREHTESELEKIGITNDILKEIKLHLRNAFKANKFFSGSIDLVFNTYGYWTIVETSNQFGSGDIRYELKRKFLENTIVSLIENVYSID